MTKPRRRARPLYLTWLALAASVAALACAASSQKPAVDAALSNDALRSESLEATLRVLDQHPEYVDELFALTLKHPKTLDRFLQNTARELSDDALSRLTARRLADHPDGLRRIMVATLDEISDEPAPLAAVSESIRERPQIAAMVLVQREESVRRTLRALMGEVGKNRDARRWFLLGVQDNAVSMASVIAQDPTVLSSLLRAFGKVGLKAGKTELEALLKAVAPGDAE
ncbi:MAG: hypothetical protein M3020_11795, partial [Myxococcota bacterium]|jgi:hypothetical protein|nr:hypothetical protein [Myxococcota bacterium]